MNLSQVVQVDLTNVIQLTLPSAGSDNMEGWTFEGYLNPSLVGIKLGAVSGE